MGEALSVRGGPGAGATAREPGHDRAHGGGPKHPLQCDAPRRSSHDQVCPSARVAAQCTVIPSPSWPTFALSLEEFLANPFQYGVRLTLRPTRKSYPKPSSAPAPVSLALPKPETLALTVPVLDRRSGRSRRSRMDRSESPRSGY